MTTLTTVAVVLVGSLFCLVDGVYWVLLAWIVHLPPSAVPLVSGVRFHRSAQRLSSFLASCGRHEDDQRERSQVGDTSRGLPAE
jgi:hypothetical protein